MPHWISQENSRFPELLRLFSRHPLLSFERFRRITLEQGAPTTDPYGTSRRCGRYIVLGVLLRVLTPHAVCLSTLCGTRVLHGTGRRCRRCTACALQRTG